MQPTTIKENRLVSGDFSRNLGGFEAAARRTGKLSGPYVATMFAIFGLGSWVIFALASLGTAYFAIGEFQVKRPIFGLLVMTAAVAMGVWTGKILPPIVRIIVKMWHRMDGQATSVSEPSR